MTAYAFRTRRMLLKDMGKAGLAIMVLGTAACASEDGESSTTAGGGETTPATGAAPETTTTSQQAPTTTGPGTDGWKRVEIDFVSAYLLARGGEALLVDTGIPGSETAIETGLAEIGLGWDAIGHIVVTHHHNDHQGSLEGVLADTNAAPWYAGAADLAQINAVGGTAVGDGDRVFDLEIIESPGHTLGHIAVLDHSASTLIAGDALFGSEGGGVVPSLPQFTADMEMANASVAKLASFDYEIVLFGHGEPITSGASQAVADLADTLS